jgi:hypothetical protein
MTKEAPTQASRKDGSRPASPSTCARHKTIGAEPRSGSTGCACPTAGRSAMDPPDMIAGAVPDRLPSQDARARGGRWTDLQPAFESEAARAPGATFLRLLGLDGSEVLPRLDLRPDVADPRKTPLRPPRGQQLPGGKRKIHASGPGDAAKDTPYPAMAPVVVKRMLAALGPDQPGQRGQVSSAPSKTAAEPSLPPWSEPEATLRSRQRLMRHYRPLSAMHLGRPCSDGLSFGPPGDVTTNAFPLLQTANAPEYPSYQERVNWVIEHGQTSSRLTSAWPDPNRGYLFEPAAFDRAEDGERNPWWRMFLARWWLYGAPKKCAEPVPNSSWTSYRSHWIRHGTGIPEISAPGASLSQQTEIMLAIDLMRINAQWFDSVTFTVEGGGPQLALGAATANIVRGGQRIAFVVVDPWLPWFDGVGQALYWNMATQPWTLSPGFASYVATLDVPADADHLVLLSSALWAGGAPGSLGDGPERGAWLLPRINADVAQTMRWTPSLDRDYLFSLRQAGLPAPFNEQAAEASRPDLTILGQLTSAAFDPPLNDPLFHWMNFYSSVLHECFHAGFAALGYESGGGDPCGMTVDPRALAQTRPRPTNSMDFHGAVQWAGAESTEWVVFGRPLGLLFGVGCCSALLEDDDGTMAGFPGDGDCGPWTT